MRRAARGEGPLALAQREETANRLPSGCICGATEQAGVRCSSPLEVRLSVHTHTRPSE